MPNLRQALLTLYLVPQVGVLALATTDAADRGWKITQFVGIFACWMLGSVLLFRIKNRAYLTLTYFAMISTYCLSLSHAIAVGTYENDLILFALWITHILSLMIVYFLSVISRPSKSIFTMEDDDVLSRLEYKPIHDG